MIITRENEKFEIMITREEYVNIAEKENEYLTEENQYDIYEIENMELDSINISEEMLNECEEGFYMWEETFWKLIKNYTSIIPLDGDFEIRVNL